MFANLQNNIKNQGLTDPHNRTFTVHYTKQQNIIPLAYLTPPNLTRYHHMPTRKSALSKGRLPTPTTNYYSVTHFNTTYHKTVSFDTT